MDGATAAEPGRARRSGAPSVPPSPTPPWLGWGCRPGRAAAVLGRPPGRARRAIPCMRTTLCPRPARLVRHSARAGVLRRARRLAARLLAKDPARSACIAATLIARLAARHSRCSSFRSPTPTSCCRRPAGPATSPAGRRAWAAGAPLRRPPPMGVALGSLTLAGLAPGRKYPQVEEDFRRAPLRARRFAGRRRRGCAGAAADPRPPGVAEVSARLRARRRHAVRSNSPSSCTAGAPFQHPVDPAWTTRKALALNGHDSHDARRELRDDAAHHPPATPASTSMAATGGSRTQWIGALRRGEDRRLGSL